eukprot:IDg11528t1
MVVTIVTTSLELQLGMQEKQNRFNFRLRISIGNASETFRRSHTIASSNVFDLSVYELAIFSELKLVYCFLGTRLGLCRLATSKEGELNFLRSFHPSVHSACFSIFAYFLLMQLVCQRLEKK